MEVGARPVVEPDADLEDAVVEAADRRVGRAPERFERLVLFEEVARVEFVDAPQELGGRGLVAP